MADFSYLTNQSGYTVYHDDLDQMFKSILASGQTPGEISRTYNIKLSELIEANKTNYDSEGHPISDMIKEYNLTNTEFPEGTKLNLPETTAGGLSEDSVQSKYYEVIQQISDDELGSEHATGRFSQNYLKSNLLGYAAKGNMDGAGSFTILANGQGTNLSFPLPVYPQKFTDSNHITYSDISVLGRSVAYRVYNYSGRSCSFDLELHEDLFKSPGYLRQIVRIMQSACYPQYSSAGAVAAPEVIITVGKQFKVRGVLSSDISVTWQAPIVEDNYTNCSLSISIDETTGPYSMSEISQMGGNRNA